MSEEAIDLFYDALKKYCLDLAKSLEGISQKLIEYYKQQELPPDQFIDKFARLLTRKVLEDKELPEQVKGWLLFSIEIIGRAIKNRLELLQP